VQLIGPNGSHDLGTDIQNLYDTKMNPGYDDQWDTNRNVQGWPLGMLNQISVSAQFDGFILSP